MSATDVVVATAKLFPSPNKPHTKLLLRARLCTRTPAAKAHTVRYVLKTCDTANTFAPRTLGFVFHAPLYAQALPKVN
jgi:hypothetical protein